MLHSKSKIEIANATWFGANSEDSIRIVRQNLPADLEIGKYDPNSAELGGPDTEDWGPFTRLRTTEGWFVQFEEIQLH